MIVKYKDYIIDVKREKCMAGYSLLYYSVFTPDGEEIICSFEDSAEKVRDIVKSMKMRVDAHILDSHSEDWRAIWETEPTIDKPVQIPVFKEAAQLAFKKLGYNDIKNKKTLNDFISELLKLQQDGKGEYIVMDGEYGYKAEVQYICDTEKRIVF